MSLDLQAKINLTQTDPSFAYSFRDGPEPHDEFLALRIGEDYQSYTRMRRDPHVRAQLTKRVQALLGRRVIVEGKNKKTSAIAQDILDKYLSYEAICSMLKGTGDLIGFAVLRMDWEPMGGYILPRFEFVPQNRFSFAYADPDNKDVPIADGSSDLDPKTEIALVNGYELRLLTKAEPLKGERCPKGRFLVYTFEGDGSPWGLGLGYSIFPWWSIKKQAMKAWLLHSDRIGSPPVLGTKPEKANEKNPAQVTADLQFERFLRAISPNGWANMPHGYEAKMLEDPSSSPDVHQRLIEISDAQISKAVLGEVAFSEKATGSYAANESQVADRESSLIDADCNLLDEQLQHQLWTEIQRLNYPDQEGAIVRRETVADKRQIAANAEAQASLKDRVDRDKTMQDMGYRVKPDAVKKVYGDEYVDTSVTEGEEQKQALISILQVGGTTALMTFLSGFGQSGLSKENAIAVLTAVFGVSAEVAESMLPEPPAPEAAAPTSVKDALGAVLEPEVIPTEAAPPETVDLAELLDFIFSDSFGEADLSAIDFATAKPKGAKKCKPTSVSCGNSCQRAGSKCKNKPSPEGQKAGDLLERSIPTDSKKALSSAPITNEAQQKASTPEAKASITSLEEINDRAEFNSALKDWSSDIKTVDTYAAIATQKSSIDSLQAKIDRVKASPGDSKIRMQQIGKNGMPETLTLTNTEAATLFEKQKVEAQKKVANLQKKAPKAAAANDERMVAASSIYEDLKDSLKNKKNQAAGVKDADGKMKAAYTYRQEKDHVYLDYLVTAPGNLLEGSSSTKGAGTQAVRNVVQKSIDSGRGGRVKLMALEDAIPFYKKLGFTQDGEGSEFMTLSPDAAKKLLGV